MRWIVGWSFSVAARLCEGSRGFQPTIQRTGCHCVAVRRLMRRPRIESPGFKRRSATQSHLDDATRGLKPTATIMRSLPRPGGWSCNHEMWITIRALPWAIVSRPVGAEEPGAFPGDIGLPICCIACRGYRRVGMMRSLGCGKRRWIPGP